MWEAVVFFSLVGLVGLIRPAVRNWRTHRQYGNRVFLDPRAIAVFGSAYGSSR